MFYIITSCFIIVQTNQENTIEKDKNQFSLINQNLMAYANAYVRKSMFYKRFSKITTKFAGVDRKRLTAWITDEK